MKKVKQWDKEDTFGSDIHGLGSAWGDDCGKTIVTNEWLDDDELVWCEECFVGQFDGSWYAGEVLSEC